MNGVRDSWDGGSSECIVCGKLLKRAPRFMVHLLTTGGFTSEKEHPDSQGYFPIGNDCARRLPKSQLF